MSDTTEGNDKPVEEKQPEAAAADSEPKVPPAEVEKTDSGDGKGEGEKAPA